jgi:hypothetical protein
MPGLTSKSALRGPGNRRQVRHPSKAYAVRRTDCVDNHHVLFDCGALKINDDFRIVGYAGTLTTDPTHRIGLKYLAYHREHFDSLDRQD